MNLYHIQRYNDPKNAYQVGQILEFNKSIPNTLRQDHLDLSSSYVDRIEEIDGKTIRHMKELGSQMDYDLLIKKSEKELRKYIGLLDAYLHNSSMQRREMILEEVRREFYPNRPSRYNCMWLTDEECLDSWLKLLYVNEGNYNIFEMEVDSSNIFISTDDLLPDIKYYTSDIYELSHKYWNPTADDLENSIKREYLYEGEVKVLRKVK